MRFAAPPSSRSDTGPAIEVESLPDASLEFASLPKGALLKNGRYHVIELRSSDPHTNVYVVEDSWPVRVCPRCGERGESAQERFCEFCGADLSTVTPLSLRHLARESIEDQAFAVEAKLLEMDLDHPGLILPDDFFIEAPYGPTRRYLIEPSFPHARATRRSVPENTERVLDWGIQLAEALAYLHQNGLFLDDFGLDHISIEGRRARWHCLDVIRFTAQLEPEAIPARTTRNVAQLAEILFYLATEEEEYSPDVPDPAYNVFARSLGEHRDLVDAAELAQVMTSSLEELRKPAHIPLLVGYATDVGQVRVLNEDSLVEASVSSVFRSTGTPIGVFGVADGMGGHSAGDVASQTASRVIVQRATAEILPRAADGQPLPDPEEWLRDTIRAANEAVHEKRRTAENDMGTTLVVALVAGGQVSIANVGDSRAYRLSREEIEQITTDHSLVERLVSVGQISREEAAVHPQRNVIYRTIGDKPDVEIDLTHKSLLPGEALLLCSDGLSGPVPDEKMWHIWRTSTSPQEACERLVEAANQAGGEDNITVIIVQLGR
jgi:protein phosphatase